MLTIPDGPDYQMDGYVTNLMVTVLDFQMKTDYVFECVGRYWRNVGFSTYEDLREFVESFSDDKDGNRELAQELWQNNHWTRAEFLRKLLAEFGKRNVTDFKSLKLWAARSDFKKDVQHRFGTKRHSMGIALFHWLALRLGINTIKPDIHVIRFVSDAIDRKVKAEEAVDGLMRVAWDTKRSASRLDAAIWESRVNPV